MSGPPEDPALTTPHRGPRHQGCCRAHHRPRRRRMQQHDHERPAPRLASAPGGLYTFTGAARHTSPRSFSWPSPDTISCTGGQCADSAVGSSAGIAAISAQQADFGASDAPERQRAGGRQRRPGHPGARRPGAEGVAYNLNLPAGARLHLTGPVLAGIFLGQITTWNNPAITALNRACTLPAASIAVVHRSDGSGTTYIFSNYLSSVTPAWAAKVGTGKTLNWPAGEGAESNISVASNVIRTHPPSDIRAGLFAGSAPAVCRHPQPGRELRVLVHPDHRRRRGP